jgi:hypothetical protein
MRTAIPILTLQSLYDIFSLSGGHHCVLPPRSIWPDPNRKTSPWVYPPAHKYFAAHSWFSVPKSKVSVCILKIWTFWYIEWLAWDGRKHPIALKQASGENHSSRETVTHESLNFSEQEVLSQSWQLTPVILALGIQKSEGSQLQTSQSKSSWDPISTNEKLGAMACVCHPSYVGSINRRTVSRLACA